MNENDTTIDNNNEKMLAFSVNAFYDIYKTYEKYASFMNNNSNASMINFIDELKMFAKDIGIVKTAVARQALLDEFDILLNAMCHRFEVILNIINEYGNKMVEYHNKLPLPKTEVNKILKQLNFVDYGESETTTGNLCDQRQIEKNFFELTNGKLNEMLIDAKKSCAEDVKSHKAEVAGYPEEDEKRVEAPAEEMQENEDSSKNTKSSKKTSTRKRRTKKSEKKEEK